MSPVPSHFSLQPDNSQILFINHLSPPPCMNTRDRSNWFLGHLDSLDYLLVLIVLRVKSKSLPSQRVSDLILHCFFRISGCSLPPHHLPYAHSTCVFHTKLVGFPRMDHTVSFPYLHTFFSSGFLLRCASFLSLAGACLSF